MYSVKNFKNKKFGRLICVEHSIGRTPKGRIMHYWKCECECGKIVTVQEQHLITGHTNSCGCFHKERAQEVKTIHGYSPRGEYNSTHAAWKDMKTRCHNSNRPGYNNYGGRGITVCDRWKNSFNNFLEDMGDRPKGKSLDRINNEEGYSPDNCRWATIKEQSRNTRQNIYLEYKDIKKVLKDWCDIFNISNSFIKDRLDKGMKFEEIVPEIYIHRLSKI